MWNKSISTDVGKPDTLKEEKSIPNGHLWKISTISELKNFLSRKAWITTNRIKAKAKCRKPVPMKGVLQSKEDPDRLISLKPRNEVKGYMKVPGVD